jgi:3-oxoacyl-[acyl-carrier-protein] synthase III
MALAVTKGVQIAGIVSVIPSTIEDNAQLSIIPEAERDALIALTGIRFRRIAEPEIKIGNLFKTATEKLITQLEWESDSIDVFICVTQSPDKPLPSISCRLHGEMDWKPNTLCFDINSGCSGFVYGLYTAYSLLAGIGKKNARAVLCCGDISSRFTDPHDRAVRPVFSDAASAIGIEMGEDLNEITGYFNLETDGSGRDAIKAGNATDEDPYMRMNGIDIFNYSLKHVPHNVKDVLAFAEKETDFPDLFVFHQANKLINESIRKKIGLVPEKVPYSLYEYGNTASATIPLTLGTAWTKENNQSGWILVSGFGVGFSMASGLIRFNPKFCLPPQEM